MIKVGLVGHSGRMGEEIKKMISEDSRFELAGTWDSREQKLLSGNDTWTSSTIDGVIDFSLPDNFKKVIDWCQEHQVPLVSGVTGLEMEFSEKVKSLGYSQANAPLFWASNMSLGIATVREMLKAFKVFKDEKFVISETHHVHKKDKPSGTAVTLQKDLEKIVGQGRVHVEAYREGEVFGIHEIKVITPNEEIVIKHTALNRKVFAQGSLEVLHWIVGQTPDFYSAGDFLQDVTKP